MIPFINLPVKIVRLFTSNVSPNEIAAGVCLGMFMAFIPLNGPMAIVLLICLFVFKINRLAAMLVLPLIKILYLLGIYSITDALGGLLLIKADFLAPVWSILTHFPVIGLLDLNNTLVTGGLVLSAILCFPVYLFSKKAIVILRKKYFDKIKNSKFVKWLLKIPIIGKLITLTDRLKGSA